MPLPRADVPAGSTIARRPPVAGAVGLIAYADRFGGDLRGLRELLDGPLKGLFGSVHVLPFYERIDGADAGFDPEDHLRVDRRLGSWDDLAALARARAVTADVIVNHISVRSPPFADWVARGPASAYDGMFLTLDGVFPHGAREDDLLALMRPRPGLPFTPATLGDGARRLLWTTFTPQQADIDVHHPAARAYLSEVLRTLADAGVARVRLDAVGYAVKTPGTSCFMTPATLAFVDELSAEAHTLGLEVLVEVHAPHDVQRDIAGHADLVYDFALPPLVLHAIFAGDAMPLLDWLGRRPANCVTVLDTHDGIGVVDATGLLEPAQIDVLVDGIHERTGGISRAATGTAAANVDLYQVNSTFYDALGRDDEAYLLARLLQLFVPGQPEIYYVGLLAGVNDERRLAATGVGRDVNRHRYTRDEVEAELRRPVVRRVLEAIRLRATHPAFAGSCSVDGDGGALTVRWTAGPDEAVLHADLRARTARVEATEVDAGRPSA